MKTISSSPPVVLFPPPTLGQNDNADRWWKKNYLFSARATFCTVYNKIINTCFCFLSYDGSTLLNCIECYDPGQEAWELLPSTMSAQRCDAGVTVVRHRWPGVCSTDAAHSPMGSLLQQHIQTMWSGVTGLLKRGATGKVKRQYSVWVECVHACARSALLEMEADVCDMIGGVCVRMM